MIFDRIILKMYLSRNQIQKKVFWSKSNTNKSIVFLMLYYKDMRSK